MIYFASALPSRDRTPLGRACLLQAKAASSPCSTNRRRTRSMVAMLTSTASAIRPSAQAGPFGGVGLERDAGVGQLLGGGLAGGDEVVEGLADF